ncbi:hypothetical protein GCM10009129_10580 [Psychrobacter aestuarii]|uniref:Uncharacterized protein n=1 Tax=Psychrobacter aestuarii TaxID=556327 RepID=A0ABN0VR51_9GAMM
MGRIKVTALRHGDKIKNFCLKNSNTRIESDISNEMSYGISGIIGAMMKRAKRCFYALSLT